MVRQIFQKLLLISNKVTRKDLVLEFLINGWEFTELFREAGLMLRNNLLLIDEIIILTPRCSTNGENNICAENLTRPSVMSKCSEMPD